MGYCWTCIHGETTAGRCADLREFLDTVSVHCKKGHKMRGDCPHYKNRRLKEAIKNEKKRIKTMLR